MSVRSPSPEDVTALFDDLTPAYDLLNDAFSLGLHRHWKRQCLAWLLPAPGQSLIDLCCGTGDLALMLASRVRPAGSVLGLDAAAQTLQVAARRSQRVPWLPLHWRQADALATHLPSAHADGAVMAYGLRNLSDPAQGLREMRRLLRPGARAAVLDFNHLKPHSCRRAVDRWREGITNALQRRVLRQVVVPLSSWADLSSHYTYLESSIDRFPSAVELEQLGLEAGFRSSRHRLLAGGLMMLLQLEA